MAPNLSPHMTVMQNAAQRAAKRLLRDFNEVEQLQVSVKGPSDFVSQADIRAEQTLKEELTKARPGYAFLMEESGASGSENWAWRWVVDPLDGTREFVKRNGEFTINIALAAQSEPLLGVVAAPAQQLVYWGATGIGAFRRSRGAESPIHVAPPLQPLRVVGSRSHASPQTEAYLARLGPHQTRGIGSSLKFCLVAEGSADLYPRFGPTSEWDTAAGQAVLEAAGGAVTRLDGHKLRYNCRESLINGDFVAFGHADALRPRAPQRS